MFSSREFRNCFKIVTCFLLQVTASFTILFLRITKPSLKLTTCTSLASYNVEHRIQSALQTLQTFKLFKHGTRNTERSYPFITCLSRDLGCSLVVSQISHLYPTYIPYHIKRWDKGRLRVK